MGVNCTGQSIYFKLHFDDYHIFLKAYEGCFVTASEARQSMNPDTLDCHVTSLLAMTVIWLSLRAKRGNP